MGFWWVPLLGRGREEGLTVILIGVQVQEAALAPREGLHCENAISRSYSSSKNADVVPTVCQPLSL